MDYTRGKANKKYRGNVLSYKYFGGYTRGKPKKNYDGNDWGWLSKMMFMMFVGASCYAITFTKLTILTWIQHILKIASCHLN